LQLAQALKKVKAESMEKALQSMVRLCVVAPTVNVTVGEKFSRSASGVKRLPKQISQTIRCKSLMPNSAIKKIIEQEILPKFAVFFNQNSEGVAPNGSNMDEWLQTMLQDLQTAISSNLKQVFR